MKLVKYIGKATRQSNKYGSLVEGKEFNVEDNESDRLINMKDKLGNKMFIEVLEEKPKKAKKAKIKMVIEEDGK